MIDDIENNYNYYNEFRNYFQVNWEPDGYSTNYKLSTPQIKILTNLFNEKNESIRKPSKKILIDKHFITDDLKLTELGNFYALINSGINKQVVYLNLDFQEIIVPKIILSPEETALNYYRENGWEGEFSEGRTIPLYYNPNFVISWRLFYICF